jgi:Uma2 family endonuclease
MATVTDDTLEAILPDRYEVVNGEVVELEPMSGFASEIANRLNTRLAVYADQNPIGRPRMDMLFRLPLPEDPKRKREPDLAFISFERWPESRPMPYRGNPVDVVPDLMVEVASPTDTAEDLMAKADDYLRAGARLVWLIYPRLRRLDAYTARGAPPRVFNETDALDGGEVLPGFSVPMAGLFPIPTGLPDPAGD